jgi:hypothetical protein
MYSKFYIATPRTSEAALLRFIDLYVDKIANPGIAKISWWNDILGSGYDNVLIYIDEDDYFDGFDNYPDIVEEDFHYSQHPDVPTIPIEHLIKPIQTRRRHAI